MTVMLRHSLNALSPMLVTLWGILTEGKLKQLTNALSQILSTLSGIETDSKLSQSLKADFPMAVTVYSVSLMIVVEGILILPEYGGIDSSTGYVTSTVRLTESVIL